ncbi:MAG: YihY/virulence factor BrkB family protein [Eubacteriales bacterium]
MKVSYLSDKKIQFSHWLRENPNDPVLLYLAKGLIRRFFTDDVGGSAVQMAYYILFSFFPFLIFANALAAFFQIPISQILGFLQHFLPREVVDMVSLYLLHLTSIRSPLLLVTGLVMAYYSLSRGVKYLILALHKAYRVHQERSLVVANMISLFFTLTTFLSIVLTLVLATLSARLLTGAWRLLHLPEAWLQYWDLLRFLGIGVTFFLLLALLYYLVPSPRLPFRFALPGTGAALICILAASAGFSFYVNNIASYSIIYGSIGTVIVFMIWLFMMGNIIVAGGEINHLLILRHQHATEKRHPST